MRGSNGTNPAAGRRWLFPKSHARLLDDQTETLCRVLRSDEYAMEIARLVPQLAQMTAALHTHLRAAERHIVAANERASEAQYEPPTVASMLAAA